MKRIHFYIVCACVCCQAYTQQQSGNLSMLKSMVDSMDNKYPYVRAIWFDKDKADMVYHNELNISAIQMPLPNMPDSSEVAGIFHFIDSIAQTNIYRNKCFANELAFCYIRYYSIDPVYIRYYSIDTLKKWQKDFIYSLVDMGFNHCYRYLDSYSYAVSTLHPSLVTPDIIKQTEKLCENPLWSREEAEVIAASFEPSYFVSDTLGYAALRRRRDIYTASQHEEDSVAVLYKYRLSEEELHLLGRSQGMLNDAKKLGLEFPQYCDFMNYKSFKSDVAQYEGRRLRGIVSLLDM